ncbi:MAG TPA: glycosyltransferase family 2 protein [Firmicutes bacterium]|nr:glycosyltransferase family 2 protein [Bacillota bacterium]
MKKEDYVAILIPAFNEGPRINAVLDTVCTINRRKRIVVIDDGSKDDTGEKACQYPVEVIRHPYNKGKGAALQTGIDHVKSADLWLFLDADLINLQENHIESLLQPLEENAHLGMTVGVFEGGGKRNVDLAQRYFGILNGQRGFRGTFIENVPSLNWCRFGVEIFLSKLAYHYDIPVSYPALRGITHHTKEEKFGFTTGLYHRLKMYYECLNALFNWQKYC